MGRIFLALGLAILCCSAVWAWPRGGFAPGIMSVDPTVYATSYAGDQGKRCGIQVDGTLYAY